MKNEALTEVGHSAQIATTHVRRGLPAAVESHSRGMAANSRALSTMSPTERPKRADDRPRRLRRSVLRALEAKTRAQADRWD
jgi:hypothetical protein